MKIPYKKLICIILFSFSLMPFAYAKTCSVQDAETADAMVDKINKWTDVNYVFKNFQQCDDGSIAEGNSEAIARLLVDKWHTLPQLTKLINHDPSLKPFVLNHINTTLDTDDLKKIKQFSVSACPKNLDELCDEINKAAIASL